MNNERWDEIFGQTPSSFEGRVQDTLRGLEETPMRENHTKKLRPAARTALIAAVVAVLLMGTALAIAAHNDFFHRAYGTGIAGQDAYSVPKTDEAGNIISYEEYPAVERVEADPDTAEALIGEYVASAIDSSVELCGYTFTIRDYVIDENGIGAITVDVDNPDGLNIKQDGNYYADEGEFPPFNMNLWAGNFPLDSMELRTTETATDTHAQYVVYVAGDPTGSDAWYFRFMVWNGTFDEEMTRQYGSTGQVFPNYDDAVLSVPKSEPVPAVRFAGGEVTAELSPVGVTLRVGGGASGEPEVFSCRRLVIEYADGSEYTVESEDVYNKAVSMNMGEVIWTAFNRLVEPENVTGIRVAGYHYPAVPGGSGIEIEPTEIGETLTPAG